MTISLDVLGGHDIAAMSLATGIDLRLSESLTPALVSSGDVQKWCPHKGECYHGIAHRGTKGSRPSGCGRKHKTRLKVVNAAKAENAQKSGLKLDPVYSARDPKG